MFAAALFDMDGLLVDSEPLWREAEVQVFSSYGLALRESDCAATSGLRLDEVVTHWKAHFGFHAIADAVVVQNIVESVTALLRQKATAKPGVDAALKLVRSRGLRVAVASSSAPTIIDAALGKLGLLKEFDACISAHGLAFGKPHPEVFLRAATTLGVAPTDCVVFEDSMFGVIAAKAARMRCIAVPDAHQKGSPEYVLADATLDSLADLTPALLDKLAAIRGVR